MTPEAKVKKSVKDLLKKYGAYYAMPIGAAYGSSGTPDFLVCHRGVFIAIECKAGSAKVTPLQDKALREIGKAGGTSLVINEKNIEQVEYLLTEISDRRDEDP